MSVIEINTLQQLSDLIGGDKASLHELIETFIEEGAEIVTSMKASLAEKNLDVLRRGAHSMKSSAQDFGATTLSQLNAALEAQCKNGWPETAESQTEEIAQQFSAVHLELQQYLIDNE